MLDDTQLAAIVERQRRIELKLDTIIEMMLVETIFPTMQFERRWTFEDVLQRILGDEEEKRLFDPSEHIVNECIVLNPRDPNDDTKKQL